MTEHKELFERLKNGTLRRRDFVKLTGSMSAGLALASLLGACGGDDEGPAPAGTASGGSNVTPTTGAGATTPSGTPQGSVDEVSESAEELVVAVTPDPLQMSPWLPNSMTGFSIHYHVYEPTIYRDENMELIPVLAESFEQVSPETIEIKLRQGIKFHNGEELTSAAVKFSYENIIAEESQALWKSMLSPIREVETPDDYTALVHTKEPNRALLRNLTLACIMSENIYNEIDGNWATKAIGTGPFKFVEYQPGSQVVLERNDDYWGEKPALKRIVFRIIVENGTRISSLKSGDVMMINNIPPDQVPSVEAESNLQVLSTPTARIIFCGMRNDRPVFQDVRVRQAVNYAVDKQAIVDGLFGGLTEAAAGPLAPMVFAAATDLGPWPYDPDKARQLLEESGNPNPTVVFGTANGRYINDRQVGEAIAGYMSDVGFNVQFEAPEWGDYYADVYTNEKSKYDMHLLAWGVINMEPDYQLRDHFHSQWARRTAYSNPEVDRLLDEAAQTFDDEEVIKLLHQAQALIWEDCPWVWLYFQPEIHGINRRLTNYGPRPDEYIRFQRSNLAKE